MMSFKKLFFLFLFVFVFVASTSFAFATSTSNSKLNLKLLGPYGPGNKMPKNDAGRVYEPITYESLTRLAWSFGIYNTEKDEDLNAYLIVSECSLYDKFFNNEFEWEKVKLATKEYLKNAKNRSSGYFEYLQPIYMGRYDYALEGFPILGVGKSKIGKRELEFGAFTLGSTKCGQYGLDGEKYPSGAVVSLTSPLNFSFVRTPLKLAKKYLDWRDEKDISAPESRQRPAYIRYRVFVNGYSGLKSQDNKTVFNFAGKLLAIDVFADQKMMLPLYSQAF